MCTHVRESYFHTQPNSWWNLFYSLTVLFCLLSKYNIEQHVSRLVHVQFGCFALGDDLVKSC